MKTPKLYIDKFDQAASGIVYGKATLTLFIKQGKMRYVVSKKESFLHNEDGATETVQFASPMKDTNQQ